MKQHYLPALLCVLLGGAASGKAVVTNTAANLVLGQTDFVTNAVAPVTSSFSLSGPSGITIDPISRKVFVVDQHGNRILRYASVSSLTNGAGAEAVFGQARFSTTTSGTTDLKLSDPHALFFDQKGRLWVADSGNNRVLMYEVASYRETNAFPDRVYGQPDFTTTGSGTTSIKFARPDAIWVDNADRLWVAEENNHRVLRLDSISTKANGAAADGVLGQANFTSNSPSAGSSGLQLPTGIAVSAAGTLYVTCFADNRVMVFQNAATLGNGAGANSVLGQANFSTSTSGLTSSTFNGPCGVYLTSDDTLWVCEYFNSRMLRFDKVSTKASGAAADGVVGQPDFTTSSTGVTNRKLNFPFLQPFADTNGDLWVPDRSNDRVLRFPADGTKPLLAVTTTIPKTTSLKKFTIKGTASDASGITKMQYKVNNGTVKTATGTTSWQFKASLASGNNTITIFATDKANNQSVSKVLKIKRTSGVAPLTLAAAE
ncbi:MAG: Ig-like domain-containing protein [Luteolibacter sp.]